ncbi:hypothetical protein Fmac_021122 [Flemingia macrophylla]|uniref:Uncharacterized protein n=1 Tax=Flemingia macrophylla TaxID=520843 RepID=A0ABD1LXN9_9FABA
MHEENEALTLLKDVSAYDDIFPGYGKPDDSFKLLKFGVNRSRDRKEWMNNKIGTRRKPRPDYNIPFL